MDCSSPNLLCSPPCARHRHRHLHLRHVPAPPSASRLIASPGRVRASSASQLVDSPKTCRVCKKQFKPSENHPRACFHHIAHYGGETKRKFESVHTGGTLDTPGGGEISSYWHCCGNEDPFHPGCIAGPHSSYDD